MDPPSYTIKETLGSPNTKVVGTWRTEKYIAMTLSFTFGELPLQKLVPIGARAEVETSGLQARPVR